MGNKTDSELLESARALLREVAASGISYKARKYAEVQIDHETLEAIANFLKAAP